MRNNYAQKGQNADMSSAFWPFCDANWRTLSIRLKIKKTDACNNMEYTTVISNPWK